MKIEKTIKRWNLVAAIIAVLVLISLVWFANSFYCYYQRVETFIFKDYWALVGDSFGGIFGSLWALASVSLFFIALQLQRLDMKQSLAEYKQATEAATGSMDELRHQTKIAQRNSIESNYYKHLQELSDFTKKYYYQNSMSESIVDSFNHKVALFLAEAGGSNVENDDSNSKRNLLREAYEWAINKYPELSVMTSSFKILMMKGGAADGINDVVLTKFNRNDHLLFYLSVLFDQQYVDRFKNKYGRNILAELQEFLITIDFDMIKNKMVEISYNDVRNYWLFNNKNSESFTDEPQDQPSL